MQPQKLTVANGIAIESSDFVEKSADVNSESIRNSLMDMPLLSQSAYFLNKSYSKSTAAIIIYSSNSGSSSPNSRPTTIRK